MADQNQQLSWDDVPQKMQGGETVTEQQIKDAENMGKLPVMKFLGTCVDSRPRQKNPKDAPSYFAAGLKWRVDTVIELNQKPVVGDEAEQHEGRFAFDDVALSREGEKDGTRNRRILIAKRTGIIAANSTSIPDDAWKTKIIGKRALINYIEEKYRDKDGNEKTVHKVAFDGYESVDKAVKSGGDTFNDI